MRKPSINMIGIVLATIMVIILCGVPCIRAESEESSERSSGNQLPVSFKLSPTVYFSENEGYFTPAIEFDIKYEQDSENQKTGKWRFKSHRKIRFTGALATEAKYNPTPTKLTARFGWIWQKSGISRRSANSSTKPGSGQNLQKPKTENKRKKPFRYSITTTLNGNVETDQQLKNRIAALGLYCAFNNHTYSGFYGLIPRAYAYLESAADLSSDSAKDHSADGDVFVRIRAGLEWKISLGMYFPFINETSFKHSRLFIALQAYKEIFRTGDWNDNNLDEAYYGAITYSFGGYFSKYNIDDIYLRVSTGRQPPCLENDTRVILGISFFIPLSD